MSYIVGSGTPYTNKDPSFDFIHMDSATGLPVDISSYHANIVEANKNDKAEWKLNSNHKDYFNLKNLSPAEFLKAAEQMKVNATAALRMRAFKDVGGPDSKSTAPCDTDCMKGLFCEMSTSDVDEVNICNTGKKETTFESNAIVYLMNKLVPNWFALK